MKSQIRPTLLLCAFIFAGVFGFLWLSSLTHGAHVLCPFSIFVASDCASYGLLSSVGHHISGLQSFGRSLVSSPFVAFLLLISLVGASLFAAKRSSLLGENPFYIPTYSIQEGTIIYLARFPVLQWIALHNKCDSLVSFRGVWNIALR